MVYDASSETVECCRRSGNSDQFSAQAQRFHLAAVAPELRTLTVHAAIAMPRLLDADVGELAAQERLLHQPAAAVEVLFHPRRAPRRIVALDGVDDRQMRFGGAPLN